MFLMAEQDLYTWGDISFGGCNEQCDTYPGSFAVDFFPDFSIFNFSANTKLHWWMGFGGMGNGVCIAMVIFSTLRWRSFYSAKYMYEIIDSLELPQYTQLLRSIVVVVRAKITSA